MKGYLNTTEVGDIIGDLILRANYLIYLIQVSLVDTCIHNKCCTILIPSVAKVTWL